MDNSNLPPVLPHTDIAVPNTVQTIATPVANEPEWPVKRKRKWLPILASIFAIILIIAASFGSYYYSRKLAEAPTPTAPTSLPKAAEVDKTTICTPSGSKTTNECSVGVCVDVQLYSALNNGYSTTPMTATEKSSLKIGDKIRIGITSGLANKKARFRVFVNDVPENIDGNEWINGQSYSDSSKKTIYYSDYTISKSGSYKFEGQVSSDVERFFYGNPNDIPVVGNWFGGKEEAPAVVRGQKWMMKKGLAGTFAEKEVTINLATPTNTYYLSCDWDGDGIKTPGVITNGLWSIRNSNTSGAPDFSFAFGLDKGDIPVCGNWTGRSDGVQTAGVFRTSNATWMLRNSNDAGFAQITYVYGNPGDIPVVGHWTGTKQDFPGLYRDGVFYLRSSHSAGFAGKTIEFGSKGDIPVIGDWSGSGTSSIGIVRGTEWYILNSMTPMSEDPTPIATVTPLTATPVLTATPTTEAPVPTIEFGFGLPTDIAVAGNWDGNANGMQTVGVFRNGMFYLKKSNAEGFAETSFALGNPGDIPIAGNWDGNANGMQTVGVFRNGMFYLKKSNAEGFAETSFALGNPGDIPIAGNWDGNANGMQTVGLFRKGHWFLADSTGTVIKEFDFGNATGDVPVVGRWTGTKQDFPGVYRKSNSTFYLKNSQASGTADSTIPFGNPGDKPIIGDWTGTGKSSVGIIRGNTWMLKK